MDLFAPGFRFERYELIAQLGEGGMGSVWKARHLGLQKTVVVKSLRSELARNELARMRFVREGEAAAKIRHPNVVEVFDVGETCGTPYLVMEYLEGYDLRRLLERRGALPLHEAADLMLPVCAAVAAAHDAGVVHRDLKPENIFLARGADRTVRPKVLDFGISRVADEDARNFQTATSAMLGTPRYMAPEQARGARHADAQSDQYSLGVILYQMATGSVPIDEPVLYELLRRLIHGEFHRPSALRPDLPGGFERLVLRAMALLPDARFPSVRDLGAALLPYASERTRILLGDSFELLDEGMTLEGFASVPAPLPHARPPTLVSPPPAASAWLPPEHHLAADAIEELPSGLLTPVNTTMSDAAHEVATIPLARPAQSGRQPPVLVLAGVGTAVLVVLAAFVSWKTSPRTSTTAYASSPALTTAMQRPASPAANSRPAAPSPSVPAAPGVLPVPPATTPPVPAETGDAAAEPRSHGRSHRRHRDGRPSHRRHRRHDDS